MKHLSNLIYFVKECAQRFPLALFGNDQQNKTDRFVFAAPHEQVKCVVVLTGDSITNAVSNNFMILNLNSKVVYYNSFK